MRVPVESSQYSMNVPSATPESLQTAGLVEQAIGQTLSGVAEAGQKLNKFVMEEEGKMALFTANNELDSFARKRAQDLKLAYTDGYMRDTQGNYVMVPESNGALRKKRIEEQYSEDLNTKQKEYFKNLPNGYAQTLYTENVVPKLNGFINVMNADAPTLRMKAAQVNFETEIARTSADIATNGATPLDTYRAMRTNELAIQDLTITQPGELKTYDQTTSKELTTKSQESLASSFFDYTITEIEKGKILDNKLAKGRILMAINELREVPGTVSSYEKSNGRKTFAEVIPGPKREQYIQKLQDLLKITNKRESDDLMLRASLLEKTVQDSPQLTANGVSILNELVAKSIEDPEHATKYADQVQKIFYAKAMGDITKNLRAGMNIDEARIVAKRAEATAVKEAQRFIDKMPINKKERNLLGAGPRAELFGTGAFNEGKLVGIVKAAEQQQRDNMIQYSVDKGTNPYVVALNTKVSFADRKTYTDPKKLSIMMGAFAQMEADYRNNPQLNNIGYLNPDNKTQLAGFMEVLENRDAGRMNEAEHAKFLLDFKNTLVRQNPAMGAKIFSTLVQQAVKAGANENLAMLPLFNDEATFTAVAASLYKKDFDKNYNDSFASDEIKTAVNEANDKLKDVLGPYTDAIATDFGGASAAVQLNNSLRTIIMNRAKVKFAAESSSKTKAEFTEYVDAATQEILHGNFSNIQLFKPGFLWGTNPMGAYIGPRKVSGIDTQDAKFIAHLQAYMKPLFDKENFAKFVKDNNIALPKSANGDPTPLYETFVRQAAQNLRIKATPDGKAFSLQFGTLDKGGMGEIKKNDGSTFTITPQEIFSTQVSGQEIMNVQNGNPTLKVLKKATKSTAADKVQNAPGPRTRTRMQW